MWTAPYATFTLVWREGRGASLFLETVDGKVSAVLKVQPSPPSATKQLDVLIISLDSNAAAIIVDQKKLQEGEPGKSTSRPAIQSFNQLHHLLLLLGDWSPLSERRPEAGPASASWMEKLGTN